MKVVFHQLADDEYWHESTYYTDVSPALGERFDDAMEEVVSGIAMHPFLCHNRGDGIFSVRVRGFPISVFYIISTMGVLVIAVAHERRNPKIWKSRR